MREAAEADQSRRGVEINAELRKFCDFGGIGARVVVVG